MPRNGSGTYALPAGNPVVAGTIISATWANPTLSDIANEITMSVPRNGSAPMLANLPMGGFQLTGLVVPSAAGQALVFGQDAAVANLAISGSGKRITGDFSNATEANRVSFQSTTVNGKTIVPLYPNGSGSEAGFATPTVPMVFDVLGTRNLNLAAGGNASLPGTLAMGSAFGFRNKLKNGAFNINQYGGKTLTSTNQYLIDRWRVQCAGGTGVSGTIDNVSHPTPQSGSALSAQGLNWTNGQLYLMQQIEAADTRELTSGRITVSALVWHDFGSTTNHAFYLYKANTKDDFGSVTLLGTSPSLPCVSGGWTKVSATFNVTSADVANGLQILLTQAAALSVSAKAMYFSDFQLEAGTLATPFEHRPYGLELALCQRYFQVKTLGQGVAAVGQAISATAIYGITVPMFGAMRVTPTLVLPPFSITNGISAIANNGAYAGQTAAAHTAIWMDGHISISGGGYSGLVAGNAVGLFSTGAGNQITANAEL